MNTTKTVAGIACVIVAVVRLTASVDAGAQSVPGKLVAIKRNTTGATSGGVELRPGGRIVITNTPLRDVIRFVYSLPAVAVLGGPDWLASERYDIVAEAEGEPSREQWMQIMRAILSAHFKLAARLETRDAPTYELVLARADGRLGPKLTATQVDCTAADGQQASSPCRFDLEGGSIRAVGRPVSRFVRTLGELCGRPVADKTGLAGLYDVALTWKPGDSSTDCAQLSLAMQEQLGLKLARGDQAEVLVISSAERPAEK
jgi:uncharacterized protein (TIGR03435 family)